MRRTTKILISVALVLALGVSVFVWWLAGRDYGAALDARSKAIFEGCTKVEAFRIDPGRMVRDFKPGETRFGYFPIIYKAKDLGPEFAADLAAVLDDKRTYTKSFAACYWPGIAYRVWKGDECEDVVICFKCHNFYRGPPNDDEL